MTEIEQILTAYFVLVNLIAAIVVAYDKRISKLPRGSIRRVPEKRFVALAALGGGIGTLFCMGFVRHKTKHPALLAKIAGVTAVWIALWLWWLRG